MKITVLSDVISCSSVDLDQHFTVIFSLQIQGMIVYPHVLLFEDGGSRFLQNVCIYLKNYRVMEILSAVICSLLQITLLWGWQARFYSEVTNKCYQFWNPVYTATNWHVWYQVTFDNWNVSQLHVSANKQPFARQPQTPATLNFNSGVTYTCLQFWNPIYTAIILTYLISGYFGNWSMPWPRVLADKHPFSRQLQALTTLNLCNLNILFQTSN
jgi:hypothetical protein